MGPAFPDRRAAGRALAARLGNLGGPEIIVLALPRGGLPVGEEVARALRAPLDIVLVRKVGMPGNPELALGAVAGPGGRTMVVNEELVRAFGIEPSVVEAAAAPARAELERRRRLWGGRLAPGALADKRVILVDDGIATGATMRAAIAAVRADRPAEVIVATPVAPPDVVDALSALADKVVCLLAPQGFTAVGRHYDSFPQLTDDDVRRALGDPLARDAPADDADQDGRP